MDLWVRRKKVCRVLNYIDHPLTVISTITRSISVSSFASLVGIPIGITSSVKRFRLEGKREPRNKTGSLSLVKCLLRFESGILLLL